MHSVDTYRMRRSETLSDVTLKSKHPDQGSLTVDQEMNAHKSNLIQMVKIVKSYEISGRLSVWKYDATFVSRACKILEYFKNEQKEEMIND